jgi:hypothetical protein
MAGVQGRAEKATRATGVKAGKQTVASRTAGVRMPGKREALLLPKHGSNKSAPIRRMAFLHSDLWE